MHKPYHSFTLEQVLQSLDVTEQGLSNSTALDRLQKFGPNTLTEASQVSLVWKFLRQFNSALVYILLLAAFISLITNHLTDVVVILAVLLINATIGFVQEYRTDKTVEALKKLVVPKAKVRRDGRLIEVEAAQIVPGDIVDLEEGDNVPADIRLLHTVNFSCIESSLTGESAPVLKHNQPLDASSSIFERKNMVWMGTNVATGSAKGVVVKTGDKTELGAIATVVTEVDTEQSHFKRITSKLAKQMGVLAVAGSIFIFVTGVLIQQNPWEEMFLFSIASLVSAIPEGLPAVLTVVLAIGAYRMSQKKAIVRNLDSTETLSITNIIATDKTGTLTQNTMTVQLVRLPDGGEFNVTGEGWQQEGSFMVGTEQVDPSLNANLWRLLNAVHVCNNANVDRTTEPGRIKVIGDPTEAALLVLGQKAGFDDQHKSQRLFDLPFDNKLKVRASIVSLGDRNAVYMVGAPESVFSRCSLMQGIDLVDFNQQRIGEQTEIVNRLSSQALRVLAVAYKEVESSITEVTEEHLNEFTLIGQIGMKDPARPEAAQAVAKAHQAGIRVIMLTGDHKETAIAIAKEVMLLPSDSSSSTLAYTEAELQLLTTEEFSKAIATTNVFARLTPQMKLKIARELQKQGNVIAMTGDGVNDAPVLKQANVGISMGVIGTDTAREASDIVLADDNFATIVNAVEEGRTVFANVRRASTYLVTTNFAEQFTILVTLFLGYPLPLLPVQILWLNLVTDGVCVLALAAERSHEGALKGKPRKSDAAILNKYTVVQVLVTSLTMMALTVALFVHFLATNNLEVARTIAFLAMAFTQLYNALNMRSLRDSLFKVGVTSNRWLLTSIMLSLLITILVIVVPQLRQLLGFAQIDFGVMMIVLALASVAIVSGEIVKYGYRKIKPI